MRAGWVLLVMGLGPMAGCDGGGGGEVVVVPGGDASADMSEMTMDSGRPPVDAGVEPDAGRGGEVASCRDACARRVACGIEVPGCLDDCAAASGPTRQAWFACLSGADCPAVSQCRLPTEQAAGCADICADLTICAGELPAPGCDARCAPAEVAFQACHGELAEGECDVRGFLACLGRTAYPACEEACAPRVACGLESEASCLTACLTADDAPADPLVRRRQETRDACRAAAGDDCEALRRCDQGGAAVPTRDQLCPAWEDCDLDWDIACDEVYQYGLEVGDGGASLRCVADWLAGGCPFDAWEVVDACFDGEGGLAACQDFCEVTEACGVADAAARRVCDQQCFGIWTQDFIDRDAYARLEPQWACMEAADCDEFATCVDQRGPAGVCRRHCAALAPCTDEDAAACERTCLGEYAYERHAAYRECVGGAPGCAAIGRCEALPAPPCPAYCDRVDACYGGVDDASCRLDCDDVVFEDPDYALPVLACILTAPECFDGQHTVDRCFDFPEPGVPCLGFCEAQTVCADDADGLTDCLSACGEGLAGDDGLRFAVAARCLERADPLSCPAVEACVPEDLEVDCGGLCDRLGACGAAVGDCEARCGDDPLARQRALQGERCGEAAVDCEAVLACYQLVADPPPPPPPGVAEFCGVWNACGFDFDFDCREAYDALGDGGADGLRCGFEALSPCPFDAFVPFDECWQASPPTSPACTSLCEARAVCEGLEPGPCLDACEGLGDPDAVRRAANQRGCGAVLTCPDLAACLAENGPEGRCQAWCAARSACDPALIPQACEEECVAAYPRDRQQAWLDCVEGADACGAIAACEPPAPPPCEAACARVAACGQGDEARCVADCDDAAFASPVDAATYTACVLTAPGCDGDDGVRACGAGDDGGGRTCARYCLAVDDCVPGSERPLATCVEQCALGFGGAEAVAIEQAAACLDAAGDQPGCRALRACLVEPAVDCAGDCADRDRCGVPAGEACEADCEAAADVALAGCFADARRLHRGCAGLFACTGDAPPPIDPACEALCATRARCEDDLDPLLCGVACTPADPAVPIQAACAAVARCEDQAACLALDDDVAAPCIAPCRTAAACGAFADEAACQATCTGRVRSGRAPIDYIATLAPCLRAAGDPCDAAAALACFDVAVGADCQIACDIFDACGFPDPDCVRFCELDFEDFPDEIQRGIDCAIAEMGGGVCDVEGFLDCRDGF